MVPDLIEFDRLGDTGCLMEATSQSRKIRIVGNAPDIAFEEPDINLVEAYERREQTNIGFRQPIADERSGRGKSGFQFIQRIKQIVHRLVIDFLCSGKSAAVNAVVDLSVDKIVHRIDFRQKTDRRIVGFLAGNVGKCRIERADDLRGFIADDRLELFVPENRDTNPARIFRIGQSIEFVQEIRAIEMIGKAAVGT